MNTKFTEAAGKFTEAAGKGLGTWEDQTVYRGFQLCL